MNLHDFAKLLRTRWLTVALATLVGVAASVGITLMTVPVYEASTRLFVSTSVGASASDLYNGNRLSQDRVLSYTELLKGRTLAQRTIDKLDLDMSAEQLQRQIKATSKPETVLINVKFLDESPVRARDIVNALSDEFVAMVRELETPRAGAEPDARVVVEQRAAVPTSPAAPKPKRNVAIGLLGGLLVGVGLAFLRDLIDNTFKDQKAIEETTGAGLVGSIPQDKSRLESPAIIFDQDNTAIAEAFRKLRTNLHFLSVDNPPRVIVVTSSVPNEGKSVTAINIALALAEAEHSVLLVDGDMRRPSVDKYLNLTRSVGFSTVLSGAAPLADVLQETAFPRLTVLTAGATPPNPSELLGSLAAKRLLGELREQFDYVIIDSPPLLAVTDGAVLAASADGALMMARFGQTKREQVAHAVRNLQDVGAPLLGVVMTMIPTRGGASYSYNYSYYGYYGEGKAESPRKGKADRSSDDQGTGAQQRQVK